MKADENLEYNSLSWVKTQLDTVLADAQLELSAYIEDNSETGKLQHCADHLHLVYGTLQMVEMYGAALLSEEMENVSRALLENKVDNTADAYDVLMRAMLQLPDYLEGLQAGNKDIPMVLLPLLNDLRASRNESLLSENVLFFPDIETADVIELKQPVAKAGLLKNEAKRLRPHFQLGLLGWIRGDKVIPSLKRMLAVVTAFEKNSSVESVQRFWSVVAGLIESLVHEGIDTSASVKTLLATVDRHIKMLIDEDESVFSEGLSPELNKNMLYYVARSTAGSERVTFIKEAYRLDELIPSEKELGELRSGMGGMNTELFETVSKGIHEDLDKVKDALEIFMHAEPRDVTKIDGLPALLARIADTFSMLGMGDVRQQILAQKNEIIAIILDVERATVDGVMNIAGDLLNAELKLSMYQEQGSAEAGNDSGQHGLSSMPGSEYRDVMSTVIGQALQNFNDAKEAILLSMSGEGTQEHLELAVNILEEVRGVALMMSMQRIESMIKTLQHYLSVALIKYEHKPDIEEQDVIADLVTSVEYYLEGVLEGRPHIEAGLKTGERAVEKLGSVIASCEGSEILKERALEEQVPAAKTEEPEEEISENDTSTPGEISVVELEPEPKPESVAPVVQVQKIKSRYADFEILGENYDEEILEIFIEEAVEELGELHEYYPRWKRDPDDADSIARIRRSFHTIKGSGRLIGAKLIGEYAWVYENMFNKLIEKTIEASSDMYAVIEDGLNVLPQLIEQLKGNRDPIENLFLLLERSDAICKGEPLPSVQIEIEESPDDVILDVPATDEAAPVEPVEEIELEAEGLTEIEATDEPATVDDIAAELEDLTTVTDADILSDLKPESDLGVIGEGMEELSIEIDEINAAPPVDDIEIEGLAIEDLAREKEQSTANDLRLDPVLFNIFSDESEGHLQKIRELVSAHKERSQLLLPGKDLVRALHTLYGSARTAEVNQIAELCGALERYVKLRQEYITRGIPETGVELISNVEQCVTEMLRELADPDGNIVYNRALLDRVNRETQAELQAQLQLEASADSFKPKSISDEVAAGEGGEFESIKLDELKIVGKKPVAGDDGEIEDEEKRLNNEMTLFSYSDIDDELIDIFLEEAEELLEGCEKCLRAWSKNRNDVEAVKELQRSMHTLKGGARMADLIPIGNLTHALESTVVAVTDGQIDVTGGVLDTVNDTFDHLSEMLQAVKDRHPLEPANELIQHLYACHQGEAPDKRVQERYDVDLQDLQPVDKSEEAESNIGDSGQVLTELEPEEVSISSTGKLDDDSLEFSVKDLGVSVPTDDKQKAPEVDNRRKPTDSPQWGQRVTDANYRDTQEQVRVRADLLNDLVNYAGEVNVFHARMGKQVNDFGFNLQELDQTVHRLNEQLRNLTIETEVQIRSGFGQETDDLTSDFDPLEMDQYSTIQQLSRSLLETTADIESIRDMLTDNMRDSETLLVQESRVSNELQEGLLRTRMVRFGGLNTRLRRIVRQTSRELGKDVEMVIDGDTTEVDRTVLDRIVAPLEHMLRNAIAHGIEESAARLAADKTELGHVSLSVSRQGVDIIIEVEDDGAGIDANTIRKKAIQKGFLDADEKVNDIEVLKFILRPSFSTADEVTQISGRGVGMDVVDSEIKLLGGTLEINTEKGRGTRFTVRLPMTLAINQALLVAAGDDLYAVPLNSIEGVIRISGSELQGFYNSGETHYEFNGVEYQLKHMGKVLNGIQHDYANQIRLYPVILTKVGDKHYALHVDDLLGRREVVVKPVGQQLSGVHGISGATILADGRVVMILELSALVMEDTLFRLDDEERIRVAQPIVHEPTVMVVDDSITIRKVTSRMLERNGIQVMSAKDGIDASNILQEQIPDLMLLDIEMPRMDGYELASNMRGDERLKNIPIIMITSRTGEKHKEKAFKIGVNKYLGKPYQEDELMENILQLLDEVKGDE